MISRTAVLVVLFVIEAGIVGMGVLSVRGDAAPGRHHDHWASAFGGAPVTDTVVSGASVPEDGPHRVFPAGTHPSVSVDIGYADLTIRTGSATQFDVSVRKSTDFGPFRATAPITARRDGDVVRVGVGEEHGMSIGDNRMVTVVVPPQAQVTVTNAGDISATGLRADAAIASAGNGHIAIEDFDAPSLKAETSNGRISLIRVRAPHLDISSSNGRVEATALQARDGTIESDDGRLMLGFGAGTDALITAATENGSVHVSGGATALPVRAAGSASDDDSGSARSVRIGAGAGRLEVHASDGDIDLNQEN